jgi:hypothetical protein
MCIKETGLHGAQNLLTILGSTINIIRGNLSISLSIFTSQNEQDIHTNSENYKERGYDQNLELAVTSQ